MITSIIEIEYMILSTYAKKELWATQLLKDMSFEKYFEIELNQVFIIEKVKHETHSSIQLLDDNQATNFLVKDTHIHERSKHIDVIYHHIKNLHKRNLIQLDYVSSNDMMIDDLTKSLLKNKFKTFIKHLRLRESKINEN